VRTYLDILQDFGFQRLKTSGNYKWLDIGCGHGEFIRAISILFYDEILIRGLEPNIPKRQSAKNQGLDVDFFELKECREKFDFISSLNVFSHLPNPVREIEISCGLLNDNGEILLQTEDSGNLDGKGHH